MFDARQPSARVGYQARPDGWTGVRCAGTAKGARGRPSLQADVPSGDYVDGVEAAGCGGGAVVDV
jgi:hypothetical protein